MTVEPSHFVAIFVAFNDIWRHFAFVFTAYFDEKESPLNYKIFGPSFKFTGEMIHGEITIIDPKK